MRESNGLAVRGTLRLLQRGDITIEQGIEIVNMWIECTARKAYKEGQLDGKRQKQSIQKHTAEEWAIIRDLGCS